MKNTILDLSRTIFWSNLVYQLPKNVTFPSSFVLDSLYSVVVYVHVDVDVMHMKKAK